MEPPFGVSLTIWHAFEVAAMFTRDLEPGLTRRSALKKLSVVQKIDFHLPMTDGRRVILSRYTQPEPELQILLK